MCAFGDESASLCMSLSPYLSYEACYPWEMHEEEPCTKRLYIHTEDLWDTCEEIAREKGSTQMSIY